MSEYGQLMPSVDDADTELEMWRQLNELQPKRSELCQALESSANFYPNIHCVLQVLLTMPVSTASAERSFSTTRRLKTYLRSTMTDKRLTGLALINIHTDLEIDSEEVLKQFDATGRRAMRLGCNPLFARVCECAWVSLAFYLSPLNNVTYKHIGLAETNKQTNKQTTQEATRISGPMNRRDSGSINCCCYW